MHIHRLPADDLEYAVLAEVWELGAASVREVYERLGKPQGLVYTTIGKVLDRLRGKGLVERKRDGKAFIYRSTVARDDVERARAEYALSRFLGPTPRAAVAALVNAVDAVNPLLLEELERAVTAHRRSKRGA
jgi:predicted transcriptional regulator